MLTLPFLRCFGVLVCFVAKVMYSMYSPWPLHSLSDVQGKRQGWFFFLLKDACFDLEQWDQAGFSLKLQERKEIQHEHEWFTLQSEKDLELLMFLLPTQVDRFYTEIQQVKFFSSGSTWGAFNLLNFCLSDSHTA